MTEAKKKRPNRKGGMSNPSQGSGSLIGAITKNGVPKVGANASFLQQTGPRTIGGLSIVTDAVIDIPVIPVMPLDDNESLWTLANKFYSEIRERNSGAANYEPIDVLAYALNVRSARIAIIQAAKLINAETVAERNYAAQGMVFPGVAGMTTIASQRDNLARDRNELAVLANLVEGFGVPNWAIYDMDEKLFAPIYSDGNARRPSYVSLNPVCLGRYTISSGKLLRLKTAVSGVTDRGIAYHWLTLAKAILGDLTSGTSKNAIIRGDMINAFGAAALHRTLSPRIGNLEVKALTDRRGDVGSIIENMALYGAEDYSKLTIPCSAASPYIEEETTGNPATDKLEIRFGGVTDPSYIQSIGTMSKRLIIAHGGAPSDAEVQAMLLLAPKAERVNDATNSRWVFNACAGYVPIGINFVDSTSVEAASSSFTVGVALLNSNTDQFEAYIAPFSRKPMVVYQSLSWKLPGDFEDVAEVTSDEVDTFIKWTIRSAFDAARPRGEHGRADTRP